MPNEPQIFWNFSIELYAREGVATACLELQNLYQLDVNLILFSLWYGINHGQIDRGLLQDVVNFSTNWREHVVQPLRNARSWMKINSSSQMGFASLREKIKANELAAEKYQQDYLAKLIANAGDSQESSGGADAALVNIDLLLQHEGVERDERLNRGLAIIFGAAGL